MAVTTYGNATPVALIADPFANQIALCSQSGTFAMVDNWMNPLDLLGDSSLYIKQSFGVGIVILNSLSRPLKLVDSTFSCYGPIPDDVAQTGYPASVDPKGNITNQNEIPAARPYPLQAKHLSSSGAPLMMAGLGVYHYLVWGQTLGMGGALKFSYKENGTGPYLGIAFYIDIKLASAVTVDVDGKSGGLDAFLSSLRPNTFVYSDDHSQDLNPPPDPDTTAICGLFLDDPHADPTVEPNYFAMTIWVRDASSTVGV